MKNWKKYTVVLLAAILLLTPCRLAYASEKQEIFSDISEDAWYTEAVRYVYEHGLMTGMDRHTFSPDVTANRAMMAMVLYRAAGSPEVSGHADFSDTDSKAWYSDAVDWAAEAGIVSGYVDGRFGPGDPVTREQAVTMLWRYADRPSASPGEDFTDESEISSFAAGAVDWARANGVAGGLGNNLFAPQGLATRSQIAMILKNYFSKKESSNMGENTEKEGGLVPEQVLDGEEGEIHYSYYLPENYDTSRTYPLVMAMPGYGEMWFGEDSSGSNLNWNGFKNWTELDEPVIVVSAQLTDWGEKSARQAIELTEYFIGNFSVDEDRIYAAGYSAGGETMSRAVAMRPDLYAAYLHGASQWDGSYAPVAEEGVAVYIFMAENDEYYGSQKARDAYDNLRTAFQDAGWSDAEIEGLLVADIPDNAWFNERGIYNYHGGGNIVFEDKEILNWILEHSKKGHKPASGLEDLPEEYGYGGWSYDLAMKKLPLPAGNETVLNTAADPGNIQVLYLWEKGNAPAATTFTEDMTGYFDDWDFRPYLTAIPVRPGVKPKGAVVLLAGGAYQFRGNYTDSLPTADALRELGFLTFIVDYRLRPYTQEEGALDVARAVRFIRKNADIYGIDSENIAVMGFSAGGIQAGEFLMHYDGNVNGTALDPDYIPDELDDVPAYASADGMIYSFYGRLSVGNMDPDWLSGGNLPPTFYVYGTEDPFYNQFEQQYAVLEEMRHPVERIVLQGWPHGFGAEGGWVEDYASWLEDIWAQTGNRTETENGSHQTPDSSAENTKDVRENSIPKELSEIPEEYFSPAENQGTLVDLNYDTYESFSYEQKSQPLRKHAVIYLPSGYDESRQYDIFYLMHGGWGNENMTLGTPEESSGFKNVIDHMIDAGEIRPIIIVCPTYNNTSPDDSASFSLALQLNQNYHNELINDLIPAVESRYSTYAASTSTKDLIASRDHRGFGGFSMGSVATWRTFQNCLDYFRYFLPMSCGTGLTDPDIYAAAEKRQDFFVWIITGTEDFAHSYDTSRVETMRQLPGFTEGDSEADGNFAYRVKEGYNHGGIASMEYTYNGLRFFWGKDEKQENGTSLPFTTGTAISDVINAPAFGDYGRLIFPVDTGYYSGKTLGDLRLTWYSNIDPDKTVEIANYMKSHAQAGETIFYDIYTDEEKAADPDKADTGLFFFKGNPGEKFAVCNAGGGFAYVGAMHDSFPHALELSKMGYNAFALIYRPGWDTAMEDLSRAISFIFKHADELEVDTDCYSLWGGSAGARMAADVGSYGTAAFGGDDLPQAGCVVMQYTGHSEWQKTDPPTYVCVGTSDGIANWRTMQSRIEAMSAAGIPTEFHAYEGLSHGFGLGTGTVAEGWLDDAVAFWEEQM